jgi:hypothetical protein
MQIKAKYLSILLGLFYCLFLLWNRLIRTRKPIHLFMEYNMIRIFIYLCLCIMSLFLVLFFIRKLLHIKPKMLLLKQLLEKPSMITFMAFIEEYILNAPKNLYEWVYEHIHIRDRMTLIGQFIYYQKFNENPYKMRIIIGFLYSFQLIICLTFIHNIFLLHKLTYFYKVLLLLLIPMFFRLLLFMQYDLSKKLKNNIETFMTFVPNESNDGFIMDRADNHKDNQNLTKERMDYFASYWYMYLYCLMSIDHFYRLEDKAKPYVYIFCYSLYALGWGYILYRICLNDSSSDTFQWLWTIQNREEPFSLTNLFGP